MSNIAQKQVVVNNARDWRENIDAWVEYLKECGYIAVPITQQAVKLKRDGSLEGYSPKEPIARWTSRVSGDGSDSAQLFRVASSRLRSGGYDDSYLGLAISCAASGIVVLDVDVKNGGDYNTHVSALLQAAGLAPESDRFTEVWNLLLNSLIIQTPSGGWHVYMRCPDDVKVPTIKGAVPNVDIRAGWNDGLRCISGGLAYAPPTTVANCCYSVAQWLGSDKNTDMPAVANLPELPPELCEFLKAKPRAGSVSPYKLVTPATDADLMRYESAVRQLSGYAKDGQRYYHNDYGRWFQVVAALYHEARANGIAEDWARALAHEFSQGDLYDSDELDRKWDAGHLDYGSGTSAVLRMGSIIQWASEKGWRDPAKSDSHVVRGCAGARHTALAEPIWTARESSVSCKASN